MCKLPPKDSSFFVSSLLQLLHLLCMCLSSSDQGHREDTAERERLRSELECTRTTADTIEQELVHMEERMLALGE